MPYNLFDFFPRVTKLRVDNKHESIVLKCLDITVPGKVVFRMGILNY